MDWSVVGELLEKYGLPLVGLLAVAWAWYKERLRNHELNAEVRENSCEMTAALVSVKDSTSAFTSVLSTLGNRMENCEKHIDEVTRKAHDDMDDRLEAIEKQFIELNTSLRE